MADEWQYKGFTYLISLERKEVRKRDARTKRYVLYEGPLKEEILGEFCRARGTQSARDTLNKRVGGIKPKYGAGKHW